jgi:hypothetical protein
MRQRIHSFNLCVKLIILVVCTAMLVTTMNVWALASPPAKNPAPKGYTGQKFAFNYYFAEGTTRKGFQEYLSLLNASSEDGTVFVSYLFPDKQGLIKSYVVPAGSRKTLSVNDEVGPDQDVSIVASSNTPFAAERPMYFDYDGYDDCHDLAGPSALRDSFYFAEGTTRDGFEEWLCMANPSPETVSAKALFFAEGSQQESAIEIAPWSRKTLKVRDIVGPGKDVSTIVLASAPVAAERVQYFKDASRSGGQVIDYDKH